MLLMTALLFFGVEFLKYDSLVQETQVSSSNRFQAQSLAQAGLDHAESLLQSGSGAGSYGRYDVGAGAYGFTVTPVTGGYEVKSVGSVGGVAARWTAYFEVSGGTEEGGSVGSLRSVGNVTVRGTGSGASLTLEGPGTLSGEVLLPNAGVITGSYEVQPSLSPMEFDGAAFESKADQVLAGAQELGPGTDTGIIYVNGSVSIRPPYTLNGVLYVTGALHITNNNQSTVEFNPPDGEPVAVAVQGEFYAEKIDLLTAQGHLLAGGTMRFFKIDDVTVDGGLASNTGIEIEDKTDVVATYLAANDVLPDWVTAEATPTSVVVIRGPRRPIVNVSDALSDIVNQVPAVDVGNL